MIKKGKKTNIGFKVNLLSFDIIGGHIYNLKPGKARFIQLCIYTLQVWVASVTSLEKTENKTKKRNVETMRPSFYGSNIKDNCNLLFLTPVDYTLLFNWFLYCLFLDHFFLCWQLREWVSFFLILLFFPTSWKLFDDGQTMSGIGGSWCKQVNTANQTNRDCSDQTFLRRANSMYNLYHIRYSEAQPDSVWAQLSQLIPECLTHSKHQTRVRMHSLHSEKRTESSPETQNMCIFCLHCMISVKKKKKTCNVHRVTAKVISFQWGGRFRLSAR